jgi:hypothetical protein
VKSRPELHYGLAVQQGSARPPQAAGTSGASNENRSEKVAMHRMNNSLKAIVRTKLLIDVV